MAFIGTFSRALLDSATAVYFGGASVSILDAQGNVILGDNLPDAPTITSTIADRVYAAGDEAVTVDLRTKFDGATSYTVSPTNPAVTISDYTLTISPTAVMTQTTFTVKGINGGGASEPLTFKLTVNAPSPVLLKPFPDQSLLIGGGTVVLPLAEYFSGASAYAVSPSGEGVTISNGNIVISRTTARDVIITVTATNTTGQDTSDSFALLVAAPANQAPVVTGPIAEQAPVANVAFTSNLASHFEDPEGATLTFDYTGTLPTGITRTGAVFSGTATVTGQTASGVLRARDPGNLEAEAPVTWLVAVQPAITATPPALTEGQQATIPFNTAIDGSPTITQGGVSLTATRVGTTNEWTFTPLTTQPVSISATKAGWKPYSVVIEDVQAAVPQLVNQNGQLVMLNVTSNTAPFEITITEPAIYAGTYTITPSQFAAGPVWLVPPSISQDGDTLTLQRGLSIRLEAMEPVVLRIEWLRGASLELVSIVEGQGQETLTIDLVADAGNNFWAREVIEDSSNREVAAISNAIQITSEASWWQPGAKVHIDYEGDRARVNGISYDSIAAARSAGAIVVNANGNDTVPLVLGSAYTAAVRCVSTSLPSSTVFVHYAVYLDDGQNIATASNYAGLMRVRTDSTAQFSVRKTGADQTSTSDGQGTPRAAVVTNTPFRMAASFEANNAVLAVDGISRGTDQTCEIPAVNRLIVGNNQPGAASLKQWQGTIYEVVVIDGATPVAQLEGLLA